jgi:NADH:ubiquinone oxidoreductase subunit
LTASQVAISRGIVSTEVHDETISDFLYHFYRSQKLIQIHQKPNKPLADMAQYHSSKSEKNKIKKCIELVDCLFALAKEWMHFTACSKDPAKLEEAQMFFKKMDQLTMQALVYLQGKMDKPVGSRRKLMVKGTGNTMNIVAAKLESWKPHWVKRNPTVKAVVARELVEGHHPNDGELFGPFVERFLMSNAAAANLNKRCCIGGN